MPFIPINLPQGQNGAPPPSPGNSTGFQPINLPNTQTSPPIPAQPQNTPPPNLGAQIGQAQDQGAFNAIKNTADFLSNGILKPIVRVPFMGATGVSEDIAAATQPNWTASDAAAPVNLPWLGDVNPNSGTLNSDGTLNTFKGVQRMGATGGEGVVAAANLVNPTGNVGTNILRAGAQGALHEAQNPNSTAGSIAASGGVSAATAAILGPVLNKVFGNNIWSGEAPDFASTVAKVGAKAGLNPTDIKNLTNMAPEDAVTQAKFIQMAQDNAENADNPTQYKRPMAALADQVVTGMKQLMNIKNAAGAAIGATKEGVMTGTDIPIDPTQLESLKNSFTSDIQGPNTRVNLTPDGNLDFKGSTIEGLSGDEKILSLAWNKLKNASTLDDLMAAKDTIANHLNFNKAQGNVTAAESAVKNLVYGSDPNGSIRGIVNNASPELGELNDTFSKLSDAAQDFSKKTKVNLSQGSDTIPNSGNTWNILRRSLGNTNQSNADVVASLENLGNKYNIPELQNLQKNTWMAQRAEDLVGTDNLSKPTSFGGILGKAGQAVKTGKAILGGNPLEMAGAAHDLLSSNPDQLATFEKLLSGPKTPSVVKAISQLPIMQLLGNQVKSTIPLAASSPFNTQNNESEQSP